MNVPIILSFLIAVDACFLIDGDILSVVHQPLWKHSLLWFIREDVVEKNKLSVALKVAIVFSYQFDSRFCAIYIISGTQI